MFRMVAALQGSHHFLLDRLTDRGVHHLPAHSDAATNDVLAPNCMTQIINGSKSN